MSPEKEVLLRHEMALGSDADNVHAPDGEDRERGSLLPRRGPQSGPACVEVDDPTAAVCDLAQALGLPLRAAYTCGTY
jgi:hypothetical protein